MGVRELSVGEVADRLGVSEKTIYREIAEGRMGFFYKVRGVYRASVADLERYIDDCKAGRQNPVQNEAP